jgi:sugar lactone lactonase YvrE
MPLRRCQPAHVDASRRPARRGALVSVCAVALLGVACTPARSDPVGRRGASSAGAASVGAAPRVDASAPADPSPATPAVPARSALPTASPISSWPPAPPVGAVGLLAAGSDPSVLPGALLIVDKGNNRLVVVDPRGRLLWQWPQPGDLSTGQTFLIPDDAFFTPDGLDIVVTQEDNFVVTEVSIATRKIVWRYGQPGTPGSGPGYLWNPDDAMLLPDGMVIAADIKNCRLVELRPGMPAPVWAVGRIGLCRHAPPSRFGSPNGVFPLPDGHFLVTEINRDWVDEIDLAGHVLWSTHPPNVAYPSDSNQYKPGEYLTVDYADPGQVVIFDSTGRTIWRWNPSTGPGRLNHPSLAEPLPNGDIVVNDDRNHRVIVIDPKSNRIVWQYGHTGIAGSAPGYLNNPDGLDPVPPSSYADAMTIPTGGPAVK